MSSSLNVIALISGGKDSLFSILHCQAHGHTIVALANLHPPLAANDEQDLNSYMYQTVGHSVIPLYERALGIPLYRQEITGKAVNSSRDYAAATPVAATMDPDQQEQDETEDLVPLLRAVMRDHPEANAVSTGAILSTYQRTRVESVALRLGLTPLSYLWQYPLLPPYTQSALLHDMANVGQEAIIIKTASGGLDESFLGFDVASARMLTRLSKAMGRFGELSNGAILGEGGEFETLALDGPRPLWKRRIQIEPGPPLVDGGQAMMRFSASSLEDKAAESQGQTPTLRIPEMFDDEFKKILDASESAADRSSLLSDEATLVNDPPSFNRFSLSDTHPSDILPKNATSDTPTVFTYSNLTSDVRTSVAAGTPSRQLSKIFQRLEHVLTQWHVEKTDINHCTLLLRNMDDFTVLNPIYGQQFNYVNPPARVTIAVGDAMPEGVDVMLSVIVDKEGKDRKGKTVRKLDRQGLHVQGRSYWAPANIGPYSQAVSVKLPPIDDTAERDVGEIVYIAGQIPLIPASMEMYTDRGFRGAAALSLQHLWRIGRAKGVRAWTGAVGFIPSVENPEEQVRIAQDMWTALHTPESTTTSNNNPDAEDSDEESSDVDPWDRLNLSNNTSPSNDTTYRSPLPSLSALTSSTSIPAAFEPSPMPPCFIAQVTTLPRSAPIEWSATGLTSPSITHLTPSSPSASAANISMTLPSGARARFYTVELPLQNASSSVASVLHALRHALAPYNLRDWTAATLYAGPRFEFHTKMSLRGVQWVPCQRVWGAGGREIGGVFVGRVDGEGEGETEKGRMERFIGGLKFGSG